LPTSAGILSPQAANYTEHTDVAIVGGGACGLCAGLAAAEHRVKVRVLERDDAPMGTTAMSIGFNKQALLIRPT
jgi:2-polyprenyl-6-methoxyphenol hydroxylase-like FAD-dependent oxidoreductase